MPCFTDYPPYFDRLFSKLKVSLMQRLEQLSWFEYKVAVVIPYNIR